MVAARAAATLAETVGAISTLSRCTAWYSARDHRTMNAISARIVVRVGATIARMVRPGFGRRREVEGRKGRNPNEDGRNRQSDTQNPLEHIHSLDCLAAAYQL